MLNEDEHLLIFRRYFIIGIVLLVALSLLVSSYSVFFRPDVCGDGTSYDSCSERKPYFCEQGVLVERASVCGCFGNLTIDGDSCLSEYQTGIKTITLDYILRGEEMTLDFVVYEGLADYLSKLPRSISHINGETPTKKDFKLKKLDDEEQRYLLLPLVTEIQNLVEDKKDQIRVAISIVQKIPFGDAGKTRKIGGSEVDYARYPYEVLYDEKGICSEKSELLAFILREMGYGAAFYYYPSENHEAIAVKCPKIHGLGRTRYCFIETTGPSIMTDNEIEYVGVGKLNSEPELIVVSEGNSIGSGWYEYSDARRLNRIRSGFVIFKERGLQKLQERYGLEEMYNA